MNGRVRDSCFVKDGFNILNKDGLNLVRKNTLYSYKILNVAAQSEQVAAPSLQPSRYFGDATHPVLERFS